MLSIDNRGATEKPTDRGHGFPLLSLSTVAAGKSCVSEKSDFTSGLGQMQNETGIPINMNNIPVVDEGSLIFSGWSFGCLRMQTTPQLILGLINLYSLGLE